MVAPHDEVREAIVLARDGVQERLPRSRVAHGEREDAEECALLREVPVEEHLVAAHARRRGDVVALRFSDERVHDEPVGDLQRAPQQVFVGAVDGVARLERDRTAPAARGDEAPELGRIAVVLGELALDGALRQGHSAADRDFVAMLEQPRHAGMLRVGRLVDLLRLQIAIEVVDILHRDRADHLTGAVDQRCLLCLSDGRRLGPRDTQRDGDGKERPGREVGLPDDREVVVAPQEALERGQGARGDELGVGSGSRVEPDPGQLPGAEQHVGGFVGVHEAVDELAAVRRHIV